MNLRSLSDLALIEKTDSLVQEERDILTSLLHHLKEIERRRAYSPKYKSLFEMLVTHFKYSNDQAYFRISAMRLLSDLPEVEEKIKAGEMSLTHLNLVRTHFRQEKKMGLELTREQKLEVIERISGTTTREAERVTLSLSSAPLELKPDSVKAVSTDLVELKFVADNELLEMIEKLKGLLAHKNPNLTLGEVFKELAKLGLKNWDPGQKVVTPQKPKAAPSTSPTFSENFGAHRNSAQANQPTSQAETIREIWRRAQSQCELCGSRYALEIDHVIPRAKGGSSHVDNLRLLCRSCNQRSAIREFGEKKMARYLRSAHLVYETGPQALVKSRVVLNRSSRAL